MGLSHTGSSASSLVTDPRNHNPNSSRRCTPLNPACLRSVTQASCSIFWIVTRTSRPADRLWRSPGHRRGARMSVGFFVVAGPKELNNDKMDSAFVGHTPWKQDGGEREIDLRGPNWRIVCLKDESGASTVWVEKERPDFRGAFVQIIGWCHRLSASSQSLSPQDYRQILERFRAGKPPLDDDFGGTFVAVVYDAKRQRLAVQPDRLAMGACLYAEENGEFAASNRALRLASYFQNALDGHSILSQMRGTHIPFGRTLFAGVRRLMGSTYLEVDLARGAGEVKKPQSLYVPTREISYADAVRLVADTVKATVGRLLDAEPVQFDLTGGNDTRVLASAVENIT